MHEAIMVWQVWVIASLSMMTPANLANCSISEVGTLKVTIIRGTNWIRGVHNTIDVLSFIYPPQYNDEARY